MTNKYDWLLRKNLRSVDSLRLWSQNPRLDPENSYITLRDFAEEITNLEADRTSFIELTKSIVERGFIPADPVVVWQNEENQRFYVAEGNRRVIAIKLLRNPEKAPKSIRGIFNKLSARIIKEDLFKIPVSIAPTFEDAEWYISQRHSTSSLQKRWSAEQQRRWVAELYDKYKGDINEIKDRVEITESELQAIIRILKIKSYVNDIKDKLSPDVYKQASSFTFPLTTLDRFFNFLNVREAWKIEFDGYNVKLNGDNDSFKIAFAELIRRMMLPRGNKKRIDSRIIRTSEDTAQIIQELPQIENGKEEKEIPKINITSIEPNLSTTNKTHEKEQVKEAEIEIRTKLKNNPYRSRVICNFYQIKTDSYKINSLFEELKQIPPKYKNSTAASIRILLDLCILKYIETEKLEQEITKQFKNSLKEIGLKYKLEFLKTNIKDTKAVNVIGRLLNFTNEYSLDVLNGYVHNEDTHHLSPHFLNGFWDSLFPLFIVLVEIVESE